MAWSEAARAASGTHGKAPPIFFCASREAKAERHSADISTEYQSLREFIEHSKSSIGHSNIICQTGELQYINNEDSQAVVSSLYLRSVTPQKYSIS